MLIPVRWTEQCTAIDQQGLSGGRYLPILKSERLFSAEHEQFFGNRNSSTIKIFIDNLRKHLLVGFPDLTAYVARESVDVDFSPPTYTRTFSIHLWNQQIIPNIEIFLKKHRISCTWACVKMDKMVMRFAWIGPQWKLNSVAEPISITEEPLFGPPSFDQTAFKDLKIIVGAKIVMANSLQVYLEMSAKMVPFFDEEKKTLKLDDSVESVWAWVDFLSLPRGHFVERLLEYDPRQIKQLFVFAKKYELAELLGLCEALLKEMA